ncbi:HDIG domain-containing metalloprotein [Anaerocolumna sp. MB42-C2]|uniref:HDIG domain-containing metalloprotein n=1 Tax=Anaerocolumna sp. MB42-C2 TaxID=3070997 RepID=UPI0027DFFB26|nr:HDIG domain-containing metalloprotein [Anaerocolumna sp. MB42-C2]WMJ88049.1 HDIG domain-containing protein [Anaerocolumna sp. MB42-C2]
MKHLSTAGKSLPMSSLSGILGMLSVLVIVFFGRMNGADLATILKVSVLSVVLLFIAVFYILYQHKEIKELPGFSIIFTIIYIGSLVIIMMTKERPELTVWMSGGLLIAVLFNMYLGFFVMFNFILISSLAGKLDIEYIVYLLILGALMCLLSGFMKKMTTLGYTAIIILSMQLILIFIINNFILKNSLKITAFYSLASSLFSIGLSYGIYNIYIKKYKAALKSQVDEPNIWNKESNHRIDTVITDTESDKLTMDYNTAEFSDAEISSEQMQVHTMEEILDSEFPLLLRLRQHSLKVYKHSLLISEIAAMAAKAVGADENKAKAGGLYHEIGRIENKEYVEEGVKLAEDYHLPAFITDIIRQHNIKYEKPKSPEAAIIMITISVIATKEYLEKQGQGNGVDKQSVIIPIEKIVDNVFQMRLTRGSLDESGLTLKQYNHLKEFFLNMEQVL